MDHLQRGRGQVSSRTWLFRATATLEERRLAEFLIFD